MAAPSGRPRVICHMLTSVDGRIVVDRWPELGEGRAEYERTAETYGADAWMCGRITMEPFAGALRDEEEVARDAMAVGMSDARADFIAPGERERVAVAIDPRGRLRWQTDDIDGDHVVAVLSESVSDDYLSQLRERGVSYLFAQSRDGGVGEVDLGVALEKLASGFGVRTLLLEGGGGINGSMLRDGLIDEVSVLVAPIADGGVGVPTLFDIERADTSGSSARRLTLAHVERRAGGVLWLRYGVEMPD